MKNKQKSIFSQLFPIFALMPWFNIPSNLSFRSDKENDIKDVKLGCDSDSAVEKNTPSSQKFNRKQSDNQKLYFYWFCVKSYYTAPISRFRFNLVSPLKYNETKVVVLLS